MSVVIIRRIRGGINMQKFIFTFYTAHPLGGKCQPIYAKDYGQAREKMCEYYGNKWGFQYTEEEWNKSLKNARKIGYKLETELEPIYCER